MDIIECRTNPVGGAFMRPWLNSGVVECRAGIGQGAINGVIKSRAEIGQGAINGAPTGGWILLNVVRTPQGAHLCAPG